MLNYRHLLLPLLLLAAAGGHAQRLVGGDISLLPSYEAHGAQYYTHAGEPIAAPLDFFASEGMNAMRVRLFHTPANAPATAKGQGVVQSLDYITPLCQRIKAKGMKLLLDLHYSDTWADPSNQWTPAAWQGLSDEVLADSVYQYTLKVLRHLNDAGATPDLIQPGNEISYGMLWGTSAADALYCYPSSPTSSWQRFARLLKSGVKACREACPEARIIVHSERTSNMAKLQADNTDYAALKTFLDRMASYDVDYDIIGLSYYPYYHGPLSCIDGAIGVAESYGKDIMVVETGYSFQYAQGTNYDYSATYPITEAGQAAFTRDLIATLQKHSRVTGLFWWFPEANEHGLDWATQRVTDSWYNASLFSQETGRATEALAILPTFAGTADAIHGPATGILGAASTPRYTLDGRRIGGNGYRGVVVRKGRKVVMK